MKYQVELTFRAELDVSAVLAWFSDQRATAAGARWYSQLMRRIATLELHPDRCRLASEAEELRLEIRELLFGRRRGIYRIIFEIRGQIVYILRIRHAARDQLRSSDLH